MNPIVRVLAAALVSLPFQGSAQPVRRGQAASPTEFVSRILIDGNTAYLATKLGQLKIVNVADRANPVLLGQVTVGPATREVYNAEVALVGNYAYVQQLAGVVVVGVADLSNPTVVRTVGTTAQPVSLCVAGNRLYVGETSGLSIHSLADPSNPQPLGRYPTANEVRKVVVRDGLAYCGLSQSGLLILDVSTESNPTRVGAASMSDGGGHVFDIALEGNYAYVAGLNRNFSSFPRLKIFDIRNPVTPPAVFSTDVPIDEGPLDAISVSSGIVAMAGWTDKLHIFDARNPAQTRRVARTALPVSGFDTGVDVQLNGNELFVGNRQGGLRIMDIADPAQPQQIGVFSTSIDLRGLAVSGNYAYASDALAGVVVYDISNPDAPFLARRVLTRQPPYWLVHGGSRLLVKVANGMEIYSLANPAQPQYEAAYVGAFSDMAASQNHAFIATAEGIQTLDLANAGGPVVVATHPVTVDFLAFNGAWLSARSSDQPSPLHLFDITNPLALQPLGSINAFVSDMAIHNGSLFVFAVLRGIRAYQPSGGGLQLTDSLDFFSTPGRTIAVADGRAYYFDGAGNTTIGLVDARDPFNLVAMGTGFSGDGSIDIAAQGSYAYVLRPDGIVVWEGTLPLPPDRPQLLVSRQGGELVIRWPAVFADARLYASERPGAPWQLVTSNPPIENGYFVYVNRFPVGAAQFYILLRQ